MTQEQKFMEEQILGRNWPRAEFKPWNLEGSDPVTDIMSRLPKFNTLYVGRAAFDAMAHNKRTVQRAMVVADQAEEMIERIRSSFWIGIERSSALADSLVFRPSPAVIGRVLGIQVIVMDALNRTESGEFQFVNSRTALLCSVNTHPSFESVPTDGILFINAV